MTGTPIGLVREVTRNLFVICGGALRGSEAIHGTVAAPAPFEGNLRAICGLPGTRRRAEGAYIGHVFRRTGGSIKESSAILGIGRTTLWRKIRENSRLGSAPAAKEHDGKPLVQIADNPGRHQPGAGEINYRWLLAEFLSAGYDGHIGLEYVPTSDTVGSLGWIGEYGYSL
jgi:hypothetical protein